MLPTVNPAGCARATCTHGTCTFAAVDGDKDGDPATNCKALDGVTAIQTGNDCDDADPDVNSHHADICDGKDNNCDGLVDNGVPAGTGSCTAGMGVCQATGVLQCANGSYSKCDAAPKSQQTGMVECDGVDHNCDGKIDKSGCQCVPGTAIPESRQCASSLTVTCTSDGRVPTFDPGPALAHYCLDADGDGSPSQSCGDFCPGSQPGSYLAVDRSNNFWDCNDNNASVHPSLPNGQGPAPEVCDGVDNNCDGNTDEYPAHRVCGCNNQVSCGTSCPLCPSGYSANPADSQHCLSDAPGMLSTPNQSVAGGLFGTASDKTYYMSCPAGTVRQSYAAHKSGGNGNCLPTWTNGTNVTDCSVSVHYGASATQGFDCYVTVNYASQVAVCQ